MNEMCKIKSKNKKNKKKNHKLTRKLNEMYINYYNVQKLKNQFNTM